MLKINLLSICLLISLSGMSQIFSGSGGLIQDNSNRNVYNLSVSGLGSSIDYKFGLYGVTVNITHSHVADLNIFLAAPDNTLIELSSGNGGDGQEYTNCVFTNTSNNKISLGKSPFKSSYKPEGSLGVINNSQNPNGTWKLIVVDTKPNRDSGTLLSWNLIFNNRPSKLEPFTNSNLPLILVNTNGKNILDDPRITASMRIINNANGINAPADSGSFFKYGITIETRGSSSQSFPKKPYGFTTVLKNLADTNVSLLGLPSEHDWILNATYNDKSLMRDVLAYELARRSGRYATRYRYCELFINGQYEGIYILMEKVKRDKNRVDVTKLELKDSTGNALTGGYIVKIDKTTGNNSGGWTDTFPTYKGSPYKVYFQYDYPNGDDMVKKQRDYIASAIYKFEVALASVDFASPTKGYRQYADENTFIDYSIINEISKNVDGYRLSTYLFKDRDSKGGKLKMGPVWDFNLAFNNADYNNSSDPTGWEIDLSDGSPFWWKRFRSDTGYVNAYYCRWNQLRQSAFSLYNINKFLDSTSKVFEEASYRNFQRWPVMGVYIWPNPSPLSYSMREEVDSLKSWIEKRVNWMDATLAANCKTVKTCIPKVGIFSDKTTVCKYEAATLYADGLGNSYKWYLQKGGKVLKDSRSIRVTPDTTTTYKVVMQTKAGCKDSGYVTVKVLPLPSKLISGITSFCQGNTTNISVPLGAKTYLWSPALGLDNTASNKVKVSLQQSTTYKVHVTDSTGCYDSAYVSIMVFKKPLVTISADRDTICAQDSIEIRALGAYTYTWKAAYGLKDNTGDRVTVYPANTDYTVVGTSDKGCMDTASYSIFNFKRAPLSIGASDTQFCYGASTVITAGKGSGFNWRKTADFNGSNSNVIIVAPKTDTRYQVHAQDVNGCKDSASINVFVYPEIVMSAYGDSIICKGGEAAMTAYGTVKYEWSSDGTVLGTDASIRVSPVNTSMYMVIGTGSGNCMDTLEREVEVKPLPVLLLAATSAQIVEGQKDTLNVAGADTYKWSPASSLNTDIGNTVVASPLINTIYKVIGTSLYQCVSSDSILITVTEKPHVNVSSIQLNGLLIYPNPASDIVVVESTEQAQLVVYTVQGQMVYKSPIQAGITKINAGAWGRGVYLFCLETEAGKQYYKVVID